MGTNISEYYGYFLNYVFLFSYLAGFFDALMDEIDFHKRNSKLRRWFIRFPLFLEWLMSEWSPKWGPLHWVFGDGWHTFKIFMLVSIAFALYFSNPNLDSVIEFILGWGIGFNLTFYIFKK